MTPEYGLQSKAFLFTAEADTDDEDNADNIDTDWGERLLCGREGHLDDSVSDDQGAVIVLDEADGVMDEEEEEEDEYERRLLHFFCMVYFLKKKKR